MHYRELTPTPALRPYVRCYWTLRALATDGATPQRVLPDGCVEIVINLGSHFLRHDESGRTEIQPRALIVGPTTRHLFIAPTGPIRLIGIRFAPGGAVPFLSVSPQEVRDAATSLGDVAPPLEHHVVERLAEAPTGTEAAILDAALGERLTRARRVTDRRVRGVRARHVRGAATAWRRRAGLTDRTRRPAGRASIQGQRWVRAQDALPAGALSTRRARDRAGHADKLGAPRGAARIRRPVSPRARVPRVRRHDAHQLRATSCTRCRTDFTTRRP